MFQIKAGGFRKQAVKIHKTLPYTLFLKDEKPSFLEGKRLRCISQPRSPRGRGVERTQTQGPDLGAPVPGLRQGPRCPLSHLKEVEHVISEVPFQLQVLLQFPLICGIKCVNIFIV